ncbi:MAG: alpha/beta hydrolase [Muribaculaceae bacterium]|nr:alpha/beta hydrolase [Muribaculaceae bacterium]
MKKELNICGIKLSFWVEGEGKPVILMHGWLNTHADVQSIADALLPHFKVYNLDLPGFGESSEPAEVWGIEEHDRFLEAFIQAEGISNPILIGHSHGGRIAIQYASHHTVNKLILIDAAGVKPSRGLNYYLKVGAAKAVKHLALFLMGNKRGRQWLDSRKHALGSSDYKNSSPTMRAIMNKLVNTDLKPVMPSIKCPTLLIWGEADTATPITDAYKMRYLIPDAGLVSYPGCGHHSYLQNPVQTAAVLNSFLEKDKTQPS